VELLHERCAGLDIGKKDLKACVRSPSPSGKRSRRQEIRTFATTTNALLELRDWLVAEKVTLVVLEATGDYWRGAFYLMEDCLNVILVNAAHAKGLPGRKTDVCDAAWLCQMGECGLLRASFVPPEPIRQLRDLTRYRSTLAAERTREAQRLEKELEDAPLTELPGRWFVSWVGLARCEATVRPRGWGSGDAAGSGVVGGAAVWVAGGDRRGVRAVPAA
jgi:transposase